VFGASGANQLLSRLTYGAAAVFMTTSLVLTVVAARAGKTGLMEKLQETPAPAAPTAPAAATTEATTPAAAPSANPAPAPAPSGEPKK
jgi:preprotein translocase subunit SecG